MNPLSKTLVVCLLGMAVMAAPTRAAETSETDQADPKAHVLIDQMIEAMGGEAALKKIKTRVVEGKMSMAAQGLAIEMKMSQKAPDKVFVEQSVPGLMDAKQGFNGEVGWSQDTLLGFRQLEGAELEQLKRESNIERELRLKEEYPVMKCLPDEEFEGRTVNVIEARSEDDRLETWYLDAETHLLTKMRQKLSLGVQGEIDLTIIAREYKEIDGVQIPMKTEVKNPAFSATLTFSSVKHNVPLEDQIFESPMAEEKSEEGS